jgi:hypothetical protein
MMTPVAPVGSEAPHDPNPITILRNPKGLKHPDVGKKVRLRKDRDKPITSLRPPRTKKEEARIQEKRRKESAKNRA